MATRGVNKVILIGNVGTDPEIRYMQNGNAVSTISIATSEIWKDKQTGEKQERTDWHRIICFNKLGEIAGEYVKKGSKIYIEGSIRTRKWQDQQNQDRYTTEIIANDLQILDFKRVHSKQDVNYLDEDHQEPNANTISNNFEKSVPKNKQKDHDFENINDDEIPF